MKIAILGNNPIALEATLRFHFHGAAITWYQTPEDFTGFKSQKLSSSEFTSDLGEAVLQELGLSYGKTEFSWENWTENYYRPIVNYLRNAQEVKREEILSITKRFLAPHENINGRSRFFDLFRVIYSVDPRDFIEQQKESNPEAYERMTTEVIQSLGHKIEMYNNFDLVLDLRSTLDKASLSIAGRAVGESRYTDKVSYGIQALSEAHKISATPDCRELCLVGSGELAAEILIHLTDWLKDQRSRLFLVSHEEAPLERFLKEGNSESVKKLSDLFAHLDKEFEGEVNDFTKKLREWQELDDFVQVKIPKPVEPIPRLNFFSGHNVIAVDELIDKKRVFLTLEKPEFREGKIHPDNNFLDLKTIGIDHVLVGHEKKNESFIMLDSVEPGFFSFAPGLPNKQNAWENDLQKLEGIEDEIFKLFTPASSSEL